MNLAPIFFGVIRKGVLVFESGMQRAYELYLRSLDGLDVEIIIRKRRQDKSKNQRAYLWGVVYKVISEETGYTLTEVHDMCKMMFLRIRRDGFPDSVRSTETLSKDEYSEYVNEVIRWASSDPLFYYIPQPGEVQF